MKNSDVEKIWAHMREKYPNKAGMNLLSQTPEVASCWAAELERYTLKQVIDAIDARAAKSKRWPTLDSIKAELSHLHTVKLGPAERRAKQKQDRLFARMKAERDRLIPLRRAAGLPATAEEAKAAGMTSGEWWNALETAGLNYPDSGWGEEAVADGTA